MKEHLWEIQTKVMIINYVVEQCQHKIKNNKITTE
jgi:hypothetical protein